MMRYLSRINNKGITLIELVIVMGVSSIILVLILGIFLTGTTMYKDIYDNIEIHQQGNSIMDFITSNIMASNEIENIINYERSSFYKSDKTIELGEIILKDTSLVQEGKHIFTIQQDPKVEGRSIRYGKTETAKIEVGNYIKTIYTEPLPKGSFYNDAKGIRLTIEMEKGRSNISISKSMYFRKH